EGPTERVIVFATAVGPCSLRELRPRPTGGLPLGELRAAAGAAEAVLLPLLHAGVAGEVAGVAELLDQAGGRVGRRGGGRRRGARDERLAVGARGGRGRARRHRLGLLSLPRLVAVGPDH